jgi:hypothetical protein
VSDKNGFVFLVGSDRENYLYIISSMFLKRAIVLDELATGTIFKKKKMYTMMLLAFAYI